MNESFAKTTGPEGTQEDLLTKLQVATRLQIEPRTVNLWMKRGLLPFYKIGRSVRFRWSDVCAHLDTRCRVQIGRAA